MPVLKFLTQGGLVDPESLVSCRDDLAAETVEAARSGGWVFADLRLEASVDCSAAAENGQLRSQGREESFALGARVIAGAPLAGAGYAGQRLGRAELGRLRETARALLEEAGARALANAAAKARAREAWGALGRSLAPLALADAPVVTDSVPARFAEDPRNADPAALAEMVGEATGAADRPGMLYAYAGAATGFVQELYVDSRGSAIDQAYAVSTGACYHVARRDGDAVELYDAIGHQRGPEFLAGGARDYPLMQRDLVLFSEELADEAVLLAGCPPLPPQAEDSTVILDPHFNALLSHEILGHPAEADRCLKMETAYAGRTWFYGDRDDNQLGRQVASNLVTVFSNPALPGLGHYVYDHEGTLGQEVTHVRRGVLEAFMQSRQTAGFLDMAPNGHYMATAGDRVPLVRMSTTGFAAGESEPRDLLAETEKGFYLVGHNIPSISESRENFRISARRVYAVRRGQLGQMYRHGSLTANSRDFLMSIDGVGSDLRIYPILNCGKGQPMQTRMLGNGGPTLRGRGRLVPGGRA